MKKSKIGGFRQDVGGEFWEKRVSRRAPIDSWSAIMTLARSSSPCIQIHCKVPAMRRNNKKSRSVVVPPPSPMTRDRARGEALRRRETGPLESLAPHPLERQHEHDGDGGTIMAHSESCLFLPISKCHVVWLQLFDPGRSASLMMTIGSTKPIAIRVTAGPPVTRLADRFRGSDLLPRRVWTPSRIPENHYVQVYGSNHPEFDRDLRRDVYGNLRRKFLVGVCLPFSVQFRNTPESIDGWLVWISQRRSSDDFLAC